ncbi:hypothetical protein BJ508DRAFT_374881 [Ascobolus immersus RN42]|uniref:Uncharacterized protein n=1 Tax=Ascobolus immersus RN42 TaxID=1160509 RepID=A0A3N4IG08_ASCIM|nr:hypothetical protein BJ508DRAFT_374881 [Ascobolus immersus RN42]
MPPRIPFRPILRPFQTRTVNRSRQLSSVAQFLADPPIPLPILVPACTILLRTITTLPLTIYSRKNTIKMLALQPLISAWSHDLAITAREGAGKQSQEEWQKALTSMTKAKRKEIYSRHGCGMWRGFLAGWSTLPVWIAVSYTLRTAVWEEGLVLGSMGWIPYLNDSDPYGVLSVAAGAVMFLNAEYMSFKNPTTTRFGRVIRNLAKVMALGVIPISILQPAVSTSSPSLQSHAPNNCTSHLYGTLSMSFEIPVDIMMTMLCPVEKSMDALNN